MHDHEGDKFWTSNYHQDEVPEDWRGIIRRDAIYHVNSRAGTLTLVAKGWGSNADVAVEVDIC